MKDLRQYGCGSQLLRENQKRQGRSDPAFDIGNVLGFYLTLLGLPSESCDPCQGSKAINKQKH